MSELVSREHAIAIAEEWRGTPYRLRGRVKGPDGGCDCATFLGEYLIEIGAVDKVDVPLYSADWFCHTTDETYLRKLMKYAHETGRGVCRVNREVLPGNIMLFRAMGNKVRFNHGAIVRKFPMVVHCEYYGVHVSNALQHPLMSLREYVVLDPWAKQHGKTEGV